MKRFLVFAGDDYYPVGGWEDFVSDHDDKAEAHIVAQAKWRKLGWVHVVDMQSGELEDYYGPTEGWRAPRQPLLTSAVKSDHKA